jgi:preprotein translocase subunit YajC
MHLLALSVPFAASSSKAQAASTSSGGLSLVVFIVLMVAVFWFLVVRPQRNRQRAQQQTISSLEPGDEVVTVGGLVATVVSVDDERVVLSVSGDQGGSASGAGPGASRPVEMTFLRQAVARKLAPRSSTEEPPSEAGGGSTPGGGQNGSDSSSADGDGAEGSR